MPTPISTSIPHRRSTVPRLDQVVELLHAAAEPLGTPAVVSVVPGSGHLSVGTWAVPDSAEHPADPLIGFRAPPAWSVIGLSAFGHLRSLADETAAPAGEVAALAIRFTAVVDRLGRFSAVVEQAGAPLQHLLTPPVGWVPDALLRAVGHATPPPAGSVAAWVEAVWLDRVAEEVLRGQGRQWGSIARLHPLAPTGPVLAPADLARTTAELDATSNWSRLRRRWATAGPPSGPVVPGGVPIDRVDWFDDGSFARWVLRRLPPVTELLGLVLDAVPEAVGEDLLEALIAVEPPVLVAPSPTERAG